MAGVVGDIESMIYDSLFRNISKTVSLFWLVQVLRQSDANPVNKVMLRWDETHTHTFCRTAWSSDDELNFRNPNFDIDVEFVERMQFLIYTKLKTHSTLPFFAIHGLNSMSRSSECSLANELDYVLDEDMHLMSLSFQS